MKTVRDAVSLVELGEPSGACSLQVVPLLAREPRGAEYQTFGEARSTGAVAVTEVSEGGSVPQLRLVNHGDMRVLLVDGEELVGAKQNRVVNLTILVPARTGLDIPVSCVEAGRWSFRTREFRESSDALFARARARKTADVTAALEREGRRHADQGAVWDEIGRKSAAMGVRSPTAAMSDIFAGHRNRIEDYVRAVPHVERQVGALFAIGGRIVGLDLFDAPETCGRYLPTLVRSYALDAMEQEERLLVRRHDGAGEASGQVLAHDAIARALDELLGADARVYPAVGVGEDVRLRGARVQGAALVAEERVVHLTAFWTQDDDGGAEGAANAARHEVRSRETLERLAREGRTAVRPGPWLHDPPSPQRTRGAELWDRVEGMLLGLAVGDALGNTSESMPPDRRRARFGEIRDYLPNARAGGVRVGLPSDDTQLAFWTLEQLLEDGGLVPERLARRFTSGRIFGIGSTMRGFLRGFRDNARPWEEAGQHSAGNGALMRIAPVLVPHLGQPSPALWADAALAGLVTHNDPASIAACVGITRALWEAMAMTEPPPQGWWTRTVCGTMRAIEGETRYGSRVPHLPYEGPVWRFVARYVLGALAEDLSVRDACDRWYSGAYLLETLPSVLYILERHAANPEEAIVRAVNDTWDNDTVAAIVGAGVGALHGRDALPGRWISGLLGRTRETDDGRVFALLSEARRTWGR